MACDKVFGIYELLEHIIIYLPPRQIVTAERVSKTWKAVISDSSRITQARCIDPKALFSSWHGLCKLIEPLYDAGTDIRLHPGLNPQPTDRPPWHMPEESEETDPMKGHSFKLVGTREERAGAGEPDAHEYLTSPPVQALLVKISYWDVQHQIHAGYTLLENGKGLCGRDLHDLDAKITRQTEGYHSWRMIEGWCSEEMEGSLEYDGEE